MQNAKKKIVAIVTALTVSLWIAGPALGATADELQAQINALLAQLQSLQTQLASMQGGTTGGTGACAGITFARNLSQTMSGTDVKCLQAILNSDASTQVAATGVGSSGSETLYFGSLTKAAVIKFQQKYASEILTPIGLTAGTGYVGAQTRAKLTAMIGGTGGTGGVIIPGTGLNVALAANTPAAATIVADSDSSGGVYQGAQAQVPFLGATFTNGDASTIKVTTLAFNRTGISADADLSGAYLYDGNTFLAEYNSFTNGVLTFTNSSGLFTVGAGSSRTITLKADLSNGTASGKTIRFGLNAATAVSSDASAIKGVFPIQGNIMSTAQAADVGRLGIATGTSPALNVDPQEALDVFNFSLYGSDQKINVNRLKFTNIGSTAYTDLQNFKLYDGGVQIGTTIGMMDSDKTITFDLSANPIVLDKGITKAMHLKADILGGTTRSFQFSIQDVRDVVAYDTQYGIYIKPYIYSTGSYSWTAQKMGNLSTISSGRMTISRASDSPSGNTAKDGTNVTIAKFDLKATGEDVKITTMVLDVYGTVTSSGLYQGKIYFDGSQMGTTANLNSYDNAGSATGSTSFTFGNTFIVTAGTNHTLEIKADIKKKTAASYAGDETFTVKISSVTATGRISMADVSVGVATAYQLVVKAGALTAARNQAVADWSSTLPTGVQGAQQALVGSFVITAGSGEGADITVVKINDKTASTTFSNLQNLKVYRGPKETGTQIGNTQATLVTNTTYNFYPSPYISLAANEQAIIYVYADVLTGSATGSVGYVQLVGVEGVGKTTNTAVSASQTPAGQNLYVATAGALTIALYPSSTNPDPSTAQLVAATNGLTFVKYKFTAGAGEAILITNVVVTAALTNSAATSTLTTIELYDGSTKLGGTVSSLTDTGTATFDLTANPWTVPAGGDKILTVKASTNIYPLATPGGTVRLGLATSSVTYKGVVSGSPLTDRPTSLLNGNNMYVYRTKLTVNKNANSPSGTQTAGANSTVLMLDMAADSGYDVDLREIDVRPYSSTSTPGTGALKVYWDYDNYVSPLVTIQNASATGTCTTTLGNSLASTTLTCSEGALDSTIGAGTIIKCGSEMMLVTAKASSSEATVVRAYAGTTLASHSAGPIAVGTAALMYPTAAGSIVKIPINAIYGSVIISKGETRVFKITGDTSGMPTNGSLHIDLNDGDVYWRDGAVSSDISTYTKNLPITGNTLKY